MGAHVKTFFSFNFSLYFSSFSIGYLQKNEEFYRISEECKFFFVIAWESSHEYGLLQNTLIVAFFNISFLSSSHLDNFSFLFLPRSPSFPLLTCPVKSRSRGASKPPRGSILRKDSKCGSVCFNLTIGRQEEQRER